jgi:predicted nucleotidyltransferase
MTSEHRSTPRQPTIGDLRRTILRVATRHGATNVRIFGSFARGEQRGTSDVDLPKRASLFDLIGLKLDLEEALERDVDVLTDDGISPYLQDRILHDASPL